MKRLLIIIMIIISVGLVHAQYGVLLLDTTATNTAGRVIFKYVKDANPLPVKLSGSSTISITGMSTSANQKLLYSLDSLNQINTKKLADSLKIWKLRSDSAYTRYKLLVNVLNFPDSTKYGRLKFTTPYSPYIDYPDSIAHSGGAHVDTVIWHPNSLYGALYVEIKARTGNDTLTIRMKSLGLRLVWGTNAFGLKDVGGTSNYGNVETDNTTVIITANVNRRFLITIPRGEWVEIFRKTTNSVNRANSILVCLRGINL